MPRYLIQQSHDPSVLGCQRTLEALAAKGSHFLARSDWGCEAGEHKGWLIVEAEDDADAQRMVPPVIRKTATVIRLNKFTPEQFRAEHQPPPQSNLESTHYGPDGPLTRQRGPSVNGHGQGQDRRREHSQVARTDSRQTHTQRSCVDWRAVQ